MSYNIDVSAERKFKDSMKDMIGVFDDTNSYLNNEYPKDFDIDLDDKRIVDIDTVLKEELSDTDTLLDKSVFINSLFDTVISMLNDNPYDSSNVDEELIPIVSKDFVSHSVVIDFMNIRISVFINYDKSFKTVVYVRSNNDLVYKLVYEVNKSKDTDLYFKIYNFVYSSNTDEDNSKGNGSNNELQSILNLSSQIHSIDNNK